MDDEDLIKKCWGEEESNGGDLGPVSQGSIFS